MRYSFVLVGPILGVLACSNAKLDGVSTDPGPDRVARAIEPLSAHEHCNTTGADGVINELGSVESPSVYTHSDCAGAFTVDLFTQTAPELVYVYWADTPPPTRELCETANLRQYIWDKGLNGDPRAAGTYLGAGSLTGEWFVNVCRFALGLSGRGVLTSNELAPLHTYRYAVAARQYAANGSYSQRKVRLSMVPVSED